MKSKFNSLSCMFWGGLVCGSIFWIFLVGAMFSLYDYIDIKWLKASVAWFFVVSVLGYFFWTFLFSVLTIRASITYQGNKFLKYGTWVVIAIYTIGVMGAWAVLTHITTAPMIR
ncbi:MAG: hypothetical protein LUC43_04910 [Burkholderiales bacterium]|nr:hypothetical protein [Burkholderiales bacterium]